jgi:glutathionylspermidine synthase
VIRETRQPRPDYISKVEKLGLLFHTVEDEPYWTEDACYRFTEEQILQLESATNELHRLCLEAVEHVIRHRQYAQFGISSRVGKVIEQCWEQDPPAIYGRFDLSYDGTNAPKMLEFNADTPTSLLEAAVIQWHWLEEVQSGADQFNSIWEALVAKWRALAQEGFFQSGKVHFASADVAEDVMTTAVMMDTAQEAGLTPQYLDIKEIGWDGTLCRFIDQNQEAIDSIFKLYPWEWMVKEEYGLHALKSLDQHHWIEPIWKMLLSNKAILATLWELFPGHPNLLASYLDGPRHLSSYVAKPILGREGANVQIVSPETNLCNEGPYEKQRRVYQEYAPLPVFEGKHTVIGSWVVDCESCGIGIRESDGPITEDLARFVPHYFRSKDATS